ncbi:MAG: S8 family serine peptidase [Gemmatimonadaceae bacterium]|nr:S8 family serine peptidase [Gemmatimonadaceae bacterium]
MKRSVLVALTGALGLAACSDRMPLTPSAAPEISVAHSIAAEARTLVPGEDFVAGQLIVRFRPGAARSEIAEAHRARKKADMLLSRTEILEVPVGEELATAAKLSKNPNIEFAEPDYIARLAPCELSNSCLFPDGQFFHYKWDLNNTGVVNGQTGAKQDADIDWVEAFDHLGAGFAGSAVIGILDTGIRPTHQAFTGKILGGRRFIVDGLPVTNYTDDHSHGTHVAAIAASRGGAAVPGVAYGANIKLLVGKVCNSAGSCPSSSTANGIIWAADNGANVINMSLGSFGGNPDGTGSAAQQAALQYAAAKNVLSVCATGNDDNKPNGYTGGVGYPARFPECMAVGATNWNDAKASYSNYGPQIEISAPGGDGNPLNTGNSLILAAVHTSDGSYNWKAGTSMATPQVAGLAALLYATGMTDANAIRQRMIETVDDVEAQGWDARTGAGRINVYRAITGLDADAPPVVETDAVYMGSKGQPVPFDGSGSFDPNGKGVTFAWDFGDPTSSANTSSSAQATHTYMRAGHYTVKLTVTDAAGFSTTATSIAAIPNIVPAIASFAGATLLQGELFSASGSFADADPDTWTATVSYGDSGAQALALSGRTFTLSHRYMAAGAHSVVVTVSDDDNGTGSQTALVRVLAPHEGIETTLIAVIGVGAGTAGLGRGNVEALKAPLSASIAALDRGNTTAAVAQLNAFKHQVDALQRGGKLTAASAQDLAARADRIIASMQR